MTNTITMWGNATGYGAASGSESFVLNGYLNTVQLSGANDTISLAAGGDDTINLNWSGFSNAVTDVVDLGQGLLNNVMAGNALYGANLSIGNGYGANNVSLVNHGGNTTLALGNQGALVNQFGLGLNDNITLNGDATNNVSFGSGSGADIAIGTAGDGFTNYTSTVSLYGVYNELAGGDETFAVSGAAGLDQIALGNGNNTVALGGQQNNVTLGNGNNDVAFGGGYSVLHVGSGNNTVATGVGMNTMYFAAGGAGSTDTLDLAGARNGVFGGNENFVVAAPAGTAALHLGDGDNTINMLHGWMMVGTNASNTATNSIDLLRGTDRVILNGGVDQVALHDANIGYDNVVLNGTMLGTQLSAGGSFDNIQFTADANAAVGETGGAQGLNLTFDGDATLGMGTVSITGLALDELAHITLVGMSSYQITVDNTPAGGVTLNFAHGSLDLIGLQSISNSLITSLPAH